MHSLRVLVSSLFVEAIIVVLPAVRDQSIDEASRLPKVCSITRGGETRQGSLARALAALPAETDVVLVHDAARPLVTEVQIQRVLEALEAPFEGVVSGVPLEDSLKLSSDGKIVGTVSRESVWRAQTPQAFRRRPLEKSLKDAEDAMAEATDCSELLTRSGYEVRLVEGDPLNIKLTRPEDLGVAEVVLQARSGSGPGESFES